MEEHGTLVLATDPRHLQSPAVQPLANPVQNPAIHRVWRMKDNASTRLSCPCRSMAADALDQTHRAPRRVVGDEEAAAALDVEANALQLPFRLTREELRSADLSQHQNPRTEKRLRPQLQRDPHRGQCRAQWTSLGSAIS